jgi:hypothetical protein
VKEQVAFDDAGPPKTGSPFRAKPMLSAAFVGQSTLREDIIRSVRTSTIWRTC